MVRSLLQFNVLKVLPRQDEPPINPREIFRRLNIDKPTASQRTSLSRSLSRLNREGLVERWSAGCALVGNGWRYRRAGVSS